MSRHKARLAAGKPERGVCDIGRKPGSAERQYFCEPRFTMSGNLISPCKTI